MHDFETDINGRKRQYQSGFIRIVVRISRLRFRKTEVAIVKEILPLTIVYSLRLK
jgi:hypothetical protein